MISWLMIIKIGKNRPYTAASGDPQGVLALRALMERGPEWQI
jgi:hypothetical protein